MVMYDENRKFTKLIKFMAENYYSNNSELNEAVSAFEDAIETSGNGEASFGVAGEDWERVEISQPPYTYPDAQFYALYDNGFQAPFLVCLWNNSFEELELLLKDTSEKLYKACEGLELSLCWVPGHRGHYYNERCDQMCTETMNNTNDLIVDSGYTGKKISTPRTVTGAMSVKIQVPKEFLHSKIEKLDVKKYQKKYQINRICAERLLEFRKEKKPKFKDYMMLQTGGKDNWSAMYLNQMIRHVENEELIIHTIKKYLSDEKAVNAAMRWYMRGLPLKYCIRKVLVDQEVAQSCNQKRK